MTALLRGARPMAAPAVAFVAVLVAFPAPLPVLALGLVLGSVSALVAVGIVLTYRATRVINFAQGDLGALAPVLAVSLMVDRGWSFWPAFGLGLLASFFLGALVDVVILRRFARSPRLVVTVVTIGIALLLQAGALFLPRLFGFLLPPQDFVRPFEFRFEWHPVTFAEGDLLVVLAVPVVALAVGAFLRRHRWGRAMRAAADNSDRALLLGIPVPLVITLVWVLAAGLSGLAAELRTLVLGVSIGTPLGPALLLRALAAAVIGGMQSLPRTVAAALAIGAVERAVYWDQGNYGAVDAALFVVVLAALVARRHRGLRGGEAASWVPLAPVRPMPPELRRLPEVRTGAALAKVAVLAVLVAGPAFVGVGRASLLATFLIYALVGMSLLVLTGWAGQVSLGQMGFVAVGSCVAASLAQGGWNFRFALAAAAGAGAISAMVVGAPVLRARGPLLAVATFAFAFVTASFLLDAERVPWLVPGRQLIERPVVLGKFDLGTEHAFYWWTLALVVATALIVRRLRASRLGRALVATRDNEDAAQSFGVDLARARLAALAVSGAIAGLAGGLLAYQQQGLARSAFGGEESVEVFAAMVFGGVASMLGVVIGAAWHQLIGAWFSSVYAQLLASAVGLMLVLLVLPGGVAQAVYGTRDRLLRVVARRRRVLVPSLVAVAEPEQANRGRDTPSLASSPRRQEEVEPLLEVCDLHVSRGRTEVLFGIDLAVDEGELIAVLGSNGAGKSTLLTAVCGLLEPSSGMVRLGGEDVTGVAANRIAARGVALVPGARAAFSSLSVRENLELAGWLRAGDDDGAGAAVVEVLDAFAVLGQRWHEPAGNLSGGEQRMLALGQVLVARPRLLLVDELSIGLAPAVVDQLLDVVRRLHAGGTTIVLVEQSPAIAARVALRAVFLDRGQVRFDGPMDALMERGDLLRAVFLDRGHEDRPTASRSSPQPPGTAATEEPAVLEARGLSVSFGAVDAVQDVDLAVGPGRIVGLVGHNGAGKTVLFDLLSGYTRPTAGRVLLEAVDITSWSPSRRARAGLGRSFQDARLFPSTTVTETIAVAVDGGRRRQARQRGAPDKSGEEQVAAQVDELTELLHLGAFANKFLSELSTGTRRIVDLACALALEPAVLLLDEPSAGLARREAEALAPLLLDVRARTGAALVVIEHDLELVSAIADELMALELGRVVAQGTPAEVIRHPRVVESYLGGGAGDR